VTLIAPRAEVDGETESLKKTFEIWDITSVTLPTTGFPRNTPDKPVNPEVNGTATNRSAANCLLPFPFQVNGLLNVLQFVVTALCVTHRGFDIGMAKNRIPLLTNSGVFS